MISSNCLKKIYPGSIFVLKAKYNTLFHSDKTKNEIIAKNIGEI